jgi:hypothetical protein
MGNLKNKIYYEFLRKGRVMKTKCSNKQVRKKMMKRIVLYAIFICLILCSSVWAQSYLLVVPNEAPGKRNVTRPVLCFTFVGTGPLTQLQSIPADLVGLVPYAAFNGEGELFLTNRYDGINGSISRFKFDEDLHYIPNGTITSTYLGDVHGLAFSSSSGELFAVLQSTAKVVLYLVLSSVLMELQSQTDS